jgi:hypothetical protein
MVSTFVRHGGSVGSRRYAKQEHGPFCDDSAGHGHAARSGRLDFRPWSQPPGRRPRASAPPSPAQVRRDHSGRRRLPRRAGRRSRSALGTRAVILSTGDLSFELTEERPSDGVVRVVCRHMKERELEAKVMRFVREIGIAPEGKVRTVVFDFTRSVVVFSTDEATYAAPAEGLWSDYADNVARMRPQHAPLIKYPHGRTESDTHAFVPHPD